MFGEYLERVRTRSPLVHCITNYVTVTSCANIVLACGASPIMADSPNEAEDIAALCGAVVINMGTPNDMTASSMELAGKRAKELGHPVVFDPVGVGASRYRDELAEKIMKEVRPDIVRGNYAEILRMSSVEIASRGVDSDKSAEDDVRRAAYIFSNFASGHGTTAAVSGASDIVSDGGRTHVLHGGSTMSRQITGVGCMLSSLVGAFAAVSPDDMFGAAAAAMSMMKVAASMAARRIGHTRDTAGPLSLIGCGTASYGLMLIDAISIMTPDMLDEEADYEMLS